MFYLAAATMGTLAAHEAYHKDMTVFIAGTFLVCATWLFARLH